MDNQNKRRLGNTVVDEAEVTAKEYVIWDTVISGFGLRVRPSGGKSFIFMARTAGGRAGKVRRVTIGNALKLKADAARSEAKLLSGQYHGGVDVAAENAAVKEGVKQERNAPTMSELFGMFMDDHAKVNLKEKTWKEYERLLEKVLKPEIGALKVAAITTADVSAMHMRIRHRPTQAALAVRVLSSVFTCAIEWGLREAGSNPAKIRLKGPRRRERLFSDAEVVRLKASIVKLEESGKVTAAVALGLRLLFETGCRGGEISGLLWEMVDLEEGLFRWSDTKTGVMEKAVNAEAARLLTAAYKVRDKGVSWVCPSSLGKALRVEVLEGGFERVMKDAGVVANENASLHLIRHWFASKTYSDPAIPLPLAMKMVGHKSVATAMRYAHVAQEQMKKATLAAEKRRSAALKEAEKRGKVIKLKAAG